MAVKTKLYFFKGTTAYRLDAVSHKLVYRFIIKNQDDWVAWYNRYVDCKKGNPKIDEDGNEAHVLFPYYVFTEEMFAKIQTCLGIKSEIATILYGSTDHPVLELISEKEHERRRKISEKYGLKK